MTGIRRFVYALTLALAVLALPGAARAKDELVIGISQFPASFNPLTENMAVKAYMLGLAHRPLTVHDASWTVVCMLCTQLPTLENHLAAVETLPDGRKGVAVTYTLHPKAAWGDGTPITTDDVLFTWEVGRHGQSGVASGEIFRRVVKIDVRDKKTFVLHFDRLAFDYYAVNDFELLPAHIERKAFATPSEYRNRTAYDSDTTNPGLWSGPYRVTEVVRGSYVVFEPNPQWWGAKPAFKRVVVKAIENTAALEANLLSGAIDMIAGEAGLALDQAIAFDKRHGTEFQVLYKPGLVYEHLEPNLANPVLADRRVRQALLSGLDRAAMDKQLFDGRQPPAATDVNPLDWVHAPDIAPVPFDPKKAAALLDEAGWTLSGATRKNAAGQPLVVEIASTAGNRTRELVMQVVQAQWKKLGVDVRLKTEPPRIFFGDTVRKRAFPGLALFAWTSAPENVPRSTLHSSMIPTAANSWSGQNYTGYANPEEDALIDKIEVELDRTKRKALWHRHQEIYAADLPSLPLFFRADAYILPKGLAGIAPTGHQYPTTLWVENWRWE